MVSLHPSSLHPSSLHSLRLAACAVLALCLLPRLAAAQSPDTPFFAEDLTRPKLGSIKDLDEQIDAQARMAPDGHLIITGTLTDVWVPPGKYIELVPKLQIAGFVPVVLNVFEGVQRTQVRGLEKTGELPMLRIDPPTGATNRKVVKVVVFDGQGNARTLMQCTLRARIANANPAALTTRSHQEQCRVEIDTRQTLSATYLYLGDIYMGCVGDRARTVQIEERRLPPGAYSCQMVAQNTDGILLPGASSDFTVPTRYTIACMEAVPTPDGVPNIVVPEHADEAKLKIKVTHGAGLGIVMTRVYIAGIFAGEQEGEDFTLGLPLRDVPTGLAPIEVIGVGADGVTYPVESLSVKIKNEAWEQRTYSTPEYSHIAANLPRIKEQARLVGYWLTQADNEPDTTHVSTTTSHFPTYSEITERYAPGRAGEYKANAKHALLLLAQLQLETGLYYGKLKMRTAAKNMLYRVVQELGTQTSDGVSALAAYEALKKERSTTL